MTLDFNGAYVFLLARMREASTWRGMVFIATAMGIKVRPDLADAIVPAGLALAGFLGALMPDKVSPVDKPK